MSDRYDVGELKRLALWLRQQLRMKDILHLNMLEVLEAMKNLFPDFDYKRVKDGEVENGEGLYNSELPYLSIPDNIFEALKRNEPRARFTCAHEIGHWILDHEGRRFRRPQRQRKAYERSTPQIRRDEREAEKFAAFFLAPDHLADTFSSIRDLRSRFGLSRRAAEIRKTELDADARRKKGELKPLPNSIIDFLEQARAKGYKVTSLPDKSERTPAKEARSSETIKSPSSEEQDELCINCGNFTLHRNGLAMVCGICGKRVAL